MHRAESKCLIYPFKILNLLFLLGASMSKTILLSIISPRIKINFRMIFKKSIFRKMKVTLNLIITGTVMTSNTDLSRQGNTISKQSHEVETIMA